MNGDKSGLYLGIVQTRFNKYSFVDRKDLKVPKLSDFRRLKSEAVRAVRREPITEQAHYYGYELKSSVFSGNNYVFFGAKPHVSYIFQGSSQDDNFSRGAPRK